MIAILSVLLLTLAFTGLSFGIGGQISFILLGLAVILFSVHVLNNAETGNNLYKKINK